MTYNLYVYHMFDKMYIMYYACYGQDIVQILNG